jgi:hypothetical protein
MQLPRRAEDLIGFGWDIAELSLSRAEHELRLVTHWFLTADDDSVNVDDHFGSEERTLRFLGVALPTLIEQLDAEAAVVVLPWGLDGPQPSLTVVGVGFGEPGQFDTRALTRLAAAAGDGPPFWRLESERLETPSQLAAVAAGLVA